MPGQLARSSSSPVENVQIIGFVSTSPHTFVRHTFPRVVPAIFCSSLLTWLRSLLSTQRRLGVYRRCTRGCCFERGLGRRSNPFAPLPVPPHPDIPLALCFPLLFTPPAGVRGTITRYVTTIPTAASIYHFYELDVASLDSEWLESKERRREWVDFAEAMQRVAWKPELVQGLALSSLAPRR